MVTSYQKYTAFNLVMRIGQFLVAAILSLHLANAGYSDEQLGLLFAIFPLAVILIMPIIGSLTQNLGKKNILIVAIACQLLGFILYLYPNDIILVVIARILDGLSGVTITALTLALTQEKIKDHEGQKNGIYQSINYIGRLLAPPFAFFLTDYFFITLPIITSIVILSLLFILLFMHRSKGKTVKKKLHYFSSLKVYFSHRPLWGMAIHGIAAHAASPVIQIFLSIHIVNTLGFNETSVGIVLFFYGITHLFQFIFGKWCDQFGTIKMLNLGFFIMGISLLLLFFSRSILLLTAVLFLKGFGNAIWNTAAWSLMGNLGKKHNHQGEIITSYFGIAKIGEFTLTIFSGFIVAAGSFYTLSLLSGIIVIAAGIIGLKFLKVEPTNVSQTPLPTQHP